jgi:hypothetical protein
VATRVVSPTNLLSWAEQLQGPAAVALELIRRLAGDQFSRLASDVGSRAARASTRERMSGRSAASPSLLLLVGRITQPQARRHVRPPRTAYTLPLSTVSLSVLLSLVKR